MPSIPGYGAPEGSSGLGYGSAEPPGWDPVANPNIGYGDPEIGDLTPVFIGAADSKLYPDDGGVTIELNGDWSSLGKAFRVKVRNTTSGLYYPTGYGARAAGPGSSTTITALLDGKRLRFVQPVLPTGTYDVYIYYGVGFVLSVVSPEAFQVLFRNHAREQWRMRSCDWFPDHWQGTGPRSLATEPALVSPSTEWPHLGLQSFTRATAQECQDFGGKAVTRLTADFAEAATVCTVETTLAFPGTGSFYTGGRKYSYTGVTATTFTGCTAAQVYDGMPVVAGSEVVAAAEPWTPSE